MQTTVKTVFVLAVACLSFAGVSRAMTEEENKQLLEETKDYQFKNVTTKEGLNFTIPEDMPIETRNGVTAPIPFDEYLYFKFRKLEEKMTATDKKTDDQLERIDKKIDNLLAVFAATRKADTEQKEISPQEKAGLLSSS